MSQYVARRVLVAIPTIIAVTTVVFFTIHLIPGDPVNMLMPPDLPASVQEERAAEIRERLGLDRPLHQQYLSYMGRLFQGDLGRSIRTGYRISFDLRRRIPNTVQLSVLALLFSTVLGISVGILAAVKRGTVFDNVSMIGALFWVSMPNFWLGLMAMLAVGLYWGILPASGFGGPIYTWEGFQYAILPAVTLGLRGAASISRFTRSNMLDVINQDYIRTARAKGLLERTVIYKHALRNSLLPIITLLALQFGMLLSRAVVIETVFAWPGLGRYMINAVHGRDFPVVQASVLVAAVGFIIANLLADIAYAVVDPRIRYG